MKDQLRSNPFLRDNDTLSYRDFRKINVYVPTKLIEKEEHLIDIGHVIKRVG